MRSFFSPRRLSLDPISLYNHLWVSLLLLGLSSIGKTEVDKCIVKVIFDDARMLIQVDMSEYVKMQSNGQISRYIHYCLEYYSVPLCHDH